MDQTVNIADLIKPKYSAGQDVFVITRNYRGNIEHIRPARIEAVIFTVKSEYKPAGLNPPRTDRSTALEYFMVGGGHAVREENIVGNLADLTIDDCAPRTI